MKKLFAAAGTLVVAGALFAFALIGSAGAVETSGTLSVCVNDYTGNMVAREDCGRGETHYLVEAEEVVVPAPPRATATPVEVE